MNAFSISPIVVERLGWVLVHSLWQFAAIALVGFLLDRVLRRRSSSIRYVALLCGLTLMVAAPVVTWIVVPDPLDTIPSADSLIVNVDRPTMIDQRLSSDAPGGLEALPALTPPVGNSAPERPPAAFEMTAVIVADTAAEPEPFVDRLARLVAPWLGVIVGAWCCGVVLFFVRPVWSWLNVQRLKTVGVSPVADSVQQALKRIEQKLQIRHRVQLLQSTLVPAPVVVGCFQSVILLPASFISGVPLSQLEAILAHELAHVRRYDYLVNLMQTLVETLFFYHPAVWWMSHRIRIERENCCDDLVVAVLGNKVEYGRALLAVEEFRGATASTLALSAKGGSLLARVNRLFVDPVQDDRSSAGLAALGILLAMITAAGVWSTVIAGADAMTKDEASDTQNTHGPESHGLQFRLVALSPDVNDNAPDLNSARNEWTRSADMTFGVELKNVSKEPLTLAGVRFGDGFAQEAQGTLRTEMIAPHWFEFDFTDMDGKPIPRTHREYYHQWSVLDSASTHELASGQSLIEVLRPANFNAPMDFDLPPGKYQVQVRYHGPDDEFRENVLKHWPDKAILNAWKHDVVSNSVEFEVTEPSRHTKPEDLIWGQPVNGLQAALEYRLADDVTGNPLEAPGIPVGTSIGVVFHLKNVSDKPISFISETGRQGDYVHVVNERGEKVDVPSVFLSGWPINVAWKLEPGEIAQLSLLTPGLGSLHQPGKYTVRYTVRFNSRQQKDDAGNVIFPRPGDYDNEVDTGETPLFLHADGPDYDVGGKQSSPTNEQSETVQDSEKGVADPEGISKESAPDEIQLALIQSLTEKPSIGVLQKLLEKTDREQPRIVALLLDSRRGPGAGDGGPVKTVASQDGVLYVVLAKVVPIVPPDRSGIREEDSHAEAAFVFDADGKLLQTLGGEFHRSENRFDSDDVDVVSLGPNEDWFVRVMNFQYQEEPFSYRSTYYRLANPVIQSVRFLHYPNSMSWSNGPEVVNRWGELSFDVPGPGTKQSWKLTGKDEQGIELQAKLIWDGDRNRFIGAPRLDTENTALYQVDLDWSEEFEPLKLRNDQIVISGGVRSYEHWHTWQFVVPAGKESVVELAFSDRDGTRKQVTKTLGVGYHLLQLQVPPHNKNVETNLKLRVDSAEEESWSVSMKQPALRSAPVVSVVTPGQTLHLLHQRDGGEDFSFGIRMPDDAETKPEEKKREDAKQPQAVLRPAAPEIKLPDFLNVMAVGFTDDSNTLWSVSTKDDVRFRSWDVATQKKTHEVQLDSDKHGNFFLASELKLSPDRTRVVGIFESKVCLWDATTGNLMNALALPSEHQHSMLKGLSFSADFSRIACGLTAGFGGRLSADSHAVVWDVASGEVVQTVELTGAVQTHCTALSTDGRWLAAGGQQAGLRIWEVATGRLVHSIANSNPELQHPDPEVKAPGTDQVLSLSFSPDGKLLAMADLLTVKVFNTDSGELQYAINRSFRYGKSGLVFSPDGQLLARVDTDKQVTIWSTESGELVAEFPTEAHDGSFSPDGQWFAACFSSSAEGIGLWRLRQAAEPKPKPNSQENEAASDQQTGTFGGRITVDAPPQLPMLKVSPASGPRVLLRLDATNEERKEYKASLVEIDDQSLIIGEGNGLANAFVYLRKAPAGWKATEPRQSAALITVEEYAFSPRALLVRTGQDLECDNPQSSPDTLFLQSWVNETHDRLLVPGKKLLLSNPFSQPEALPVRVTSNINSCKVMHVLALDHPFAAVTDNDGHFQIEGLPPGEHEFIVWHERSSHLEKRLRIKVEPGKTTLTSRAFPGSRFQIESGKLKRQPYGSFWKAVRPDSITTETAESGEILDDDSVQMGLPGPNWSSPILKFNFAEAAELNALRLELLPDTRFDDRRLGRIPDRELKLFEVKPWIISVDGKTRQIDWSNAEYIQDPDDAEVAALIDYATDTGWKVPNLAEGQAAHELIFRLDEPLSLAAGDTLAVELDSGGSEQLDTLARFRISFPPP